MGFFKKNKVSSFTSVNVNHTTDDKNETCPEKTEEIMLNCAKQLVIKPYSPEKTEENKEEKEWIWIEGYKGTDKDMKCIGFQFALGEEYSLPENEELIMCERSFHLCAELNQVFSFYNIEKNNRFFKVKALVEKEKFDNQTMYTSWTGSYGTPKLVAKSIIFIKELSIDEIFKATLADYLPIEYKQKALEIGTRKAEELYYKDLLKSYGYNEELITYFLEHDKFKIAYALGKQKELTMYEKISLILK